MQSAHASVTLTGIENRTMPQYTKLMAHGYESTSVELIRIRSAC